MRNSFNIDGENRCVQEATALRELANLIALADRRKRRFTGSQGQLPHAEAARRCDRLA